MWVKNLAFPFALFLLLFTVAVTAVSFSVTVKPAVVNASQTNQLLNFSVTDNDATVNITQVNITIPLGFAFNGTNFTTSSGSPGATPISWTNTSSLGFVNNSGPQNFLFAVNVSSTPGTYTFNVSTVDTNGVFNSTLVNLILNDIKAPTYSNNMTNPNSTTNYIYGNLFWFNITLTDDASVSKAILENNFTGALQNTTMNNTGNVYSAYFNNFAAGAYTWRVFANDTSNNFNVTPNYTFIPPPQVNLTAPATVTQLLQHQVSR